MRFVEENGHDNKKHTQDEEVGEPLDVVESERAVILPSGPVSFEVELHNDAPKASWLHASFHTVCAVVGAGVLGLPHAFSYLG